MNNLIDTIINKKEVEKLPSSDLIEILTSKNSTKSLINILKMKRRNEFHSQFEDEDCELPPQKKVYKIPSMYSVIATEITMEIKILIMADYDEKAFSKLPEYINEQNVNTEYTDSKKTLLEMACVLQNPLIISFLFENKATPTNQLFEYVLRENNLEIIELFLKYGYDPNSKDDYYKVPLIAYIIPGFTFSKEKVYANKVISSKKEKNKIELLVKYGANINFPVFLRNINLLSIEEILTNSSESKLYEILEMVIRHQGKKNVFLPPNIEELGKEEIIKYCKALLLLCNKQTIKRIENSYGVSYTKTNFKDLLTNY